MHRSTSNPGFPPLDGFLTDPVTWSSEMIRLLSVNGFDHPFYVLSMRAICLFGFALIIAALVALGTGVRASASKSVEDAKFAFFLRMALGVGFVLVAAIMKTFMIFPSPLDNEISW